MAKTKITLRIILLGVFILALFWASAPARAAQPVVHAVLFFSPTCPHCHEVMKNDLPPLYAEYGEQLQVLEIDASQEAGQELYRSAILAFNVTQERYGVPALYVGKTVLVGSMEIPDQFPGLIAAGLADGGIDWPAIPGLEQYLRQSGAAAGAPNAGPSQDGETPRWKLAYQKDPVGNGVAVVVLVLMLISLGFSAYLFLSDPDSALHRRLNSIPVWVVPALCVVGLGAAGYLSYIELNTDITPFCGPIAGCDEVQTSPYAKLWGIPVGIIGLVGYIAILAAWFVRIRGSEGQRPLATLALWALVLFGTLFSTYLTFLEPFVIGATCTWCITNAIVITLLLWVTTVPASIAAADM